MRTKIAVVILIILLTGGLTISAIGYYQTLNALTDARLELAKQKNNDRVINFLSLFVKKVINASTIVSFDDRLTLENSVRNLNDVQLLNKWKEFVDSKTESEAQKKVKELLDILVEKIRTN